MARIRVWLAPETGTRPGYAWNMGDHDTISFFPSQGGGAAAAATTSKCKNKIKRKEMTRKENSA